MENAKHFCTCKDLNCKLHPLNNSNGCDHCIKKNLNAREIPSCFFRLVDDDLSELKEFTIESFVDFYIRNVKSNKDAKNNKAAVNNVFSAGKML